MPRGQGIDLGLTAYAELFMDDASREEAKLPRIYDIPLSEIDDFPEHPFQVKLDEDMDQLVESIQEGVNLGQYCEKPYISNIGILYPMPDTC